MREQAACPPGPATAGALLDPDQLFLKPLPLANLKGLGHGFLFIVTAASICANAVPLQKRAHVAGGNKQARRDICRGGISAAAGYLPRQAWRGAAHTLAALRMNFRRGLPAMKMCAGFEFRRI